MANHRNDYRKYKRGEYHYVTIFDLFEKYGLQNCKINPVEVFDDITFEELRTKESEYILNNPCINKQNPKPITPQEYKNRKKEYYRNVIKADPEKLKKLCVKAKQWIEKNGQGVFQCECGDTYTYKHKARHYQSIRHKTKMEKINQTI